jgi:hypothetical protein
LVAFFEVIGFFGVAAFFAWLAFAPLQSEELLKGYSGTLRVKARENLYTINDYFLASFVSWSVAAIADYFVHTPRLPYTQSALLYMVIGGFSLAGGIMLFVPIWYIRLIVKGARTLGDINPPDFVTWLAAAGLAVINVAIFSTRWSNPYPYGGQGLVVSLSALSVIGSAAAAYYWNFKWRLIPLFLLANVCLIWMTLFH